MGRRPLPLRKCYILKVGWYKDAQINTPTPESLGATMQTKLDKHTTHLVVSEAKWKTKDEQLREALLLKDAGRDLKIVSFSWLLDCCCSLMKKKEEDYLWEKLDQDSAGATAGPPKAKKRRLDNSGAPRDGDRGPKSVKGMMVDVFNESTNPFVDEHKRKALDKSLAKEREIRRQMDEADEKERQLDEKCRNEHMALFINSSKKARADILSENHHVYMDQKNFKYDIVITRVDQRQNRNERIALTIYESNSQPYSYAMNCKQGKSQSSNQLLCAMGCNFYTAFRAFKEHFREMTGGDWDLRITDHLNRQTREGKGRGGGNSVPYEQTKFRYFPPKYGSFGVLSREDQERVDQIRCEAKKHAAQNQEGKNSNGVGVDEEWFNNFMNECFDASESAPNLSESTSTPAPALSETECDTAYDAFIDDPPTFT